MFVTVHILRALPMHNLNRDQNGLPKAQFDGGVQRARLSSQSIKRPARIALRGALTGGGSYRTRNVVGEIDSIAADWASKNGKSYDSKSGKAKIKSIVDPLVKSDDKEGQKETILLFSAAEMETLAVAVVEAQNSDTDPSLDDFILDDRSASLDIAAFGRMFAHRADLSTQAAVAVSHAVTTHQMSLTIDYFTAVDDLRTENGTDSGAGHLGLAYFTSGVYYSTFTIDTDQLARSWSGFTGDTARDQVTALVKALIKALPDGKVNSTNPNTLPVVVLAETQRTRVAYSFDTPVQPDPEGGYTRPSIAKLAEQRSLALSFDPGNFGPSVAYTQAPDIDLFTNTAADIDELAEFVTNEVFAALLPAEA